MSKREPIEPEKLKVGDVVEWVENDGDVWDVEVLDIREHGIIVDAGYGKTALFAPNSEDKEKYTLLVGTMEMDDYIRHPKKKAKKKAKQNAASQTTLAVETEPIEPEKFQVGESVEWVESDGTIWDEKVLEVKGDEVTVSYSWDRKVFAPRPGGDGRHMLLEETLETDGYIRHPKKKAKKDKKK